MNFYNIYLFPNFKNIIQKPVLFLSSNGLWIIEIEGCGCERRSADLVNILQKGSFFIAKKTIFWVQTRKVPNDSEMRKFSPLVWLSIPKLVQRRKRKDSTQILVLSTRQHAQRSILNILYIPALPTVFRQACLAHRERRYGEAYPLLFFPPFQTLSKTRPFSPPPLPKRRPSIPAFLS